MDDEQIAVTKAIQTVRPSAVWGFVAGQARAHKTLLKFMLVGLLGYLLYTATLFVAYDLSLPFMPDKHTSLHLGLFTHSDLRLLIGTIVAAEVSIIGGFFARDLWVFTDWPTADTPKWVKFLQYQAKSFVSTLGILTITVNVLTPEAGLPHYIATPIGVAVAFTWNWLWESGIIWRRHGEG